MSAKTHKRTINKVTKEEQLKVIKDWFNAGSNQMRDQFVADQGFSPLLYKLAMVKRNKLKVGDCIPLFPDPQLMKSELSGLPTIVIKNEWGDGMVFAEILKIQEDEFLCKFEIAEVTIQCTVTSRINLDEELIIRRRNTIG